MATVRTAEAHWEGSLMEGQGEVELVSSGIGSFEVSWPARAEQANGKTSPEELIAAAHSTCFSMSLALALTKAGNPPTSLDTRADVTFQPGKGITGIKLTVKARRAGDQRRAVRGGRAGRREELPGFPGPDRHHHHRRRRPSRSELGGLQARRPVAGRARPG